MGHHCCGHHRNGGDKKEDPIKVGLTTCSFLPFCFALALPLRPLEATERMMLFICLAGIVAFALAGLIRKILAALSR